MVEEAVVMEAVVDPLAVVEEEAEEEEELLCLLVAAEEVILPIWQNIASLSITI